MQSPKKHPSIERIWPIALILALSAGFVTCLLALFPYDGLYGQDSYAYYGQSFAWWRELAGERQPPNGLYSSQEFRWPVGYHLHIMLGFLLGGTGAWGGWALNIAMTAATPTLVYLLSSSVWSSASGNPRSAFRIVAGLTAAALLLLSGTYIRMGLSLMADVPALFWALVGYVCALRAWPLAAPDRDKGGVWALLSGGALGIAVLTRYGALLLVPPLLVYLALRWHGEKRMPRNVGWVALGFFAALIPQVAYLLTHEAGAGYSAFLGDWSLTNLFATNVTSADGAATYDYPMLVFFLAVPLVSASAGFLHYLMLPAFALGLWALVRLKAWPVLGLLLTWWLLPVLSFSGTPYQAHRFVILYLPALLIPVGIGVAVAIRAWRVTPIPRLLAGALVAATAAGAWQGWEGTRGWMAIHAAFKEEERQVLRIARATAPSGDTPRVVSFGLTAAIYHYTGWPILDIYNHDEAALERFLGGPGPRIVVVPEEQMATKWARTPSGKRWRWLLDSYELELGGKWGEYSVYKVGK